MILREQVSWTEDKAAAKTSHEFMALTLLSGLLSAVALICCCPKYLTVKTFMWSMEGLCRGMFLDWREEFCFQESHL